MKTTCFAVAITLALGVFVAPLAAKAQQSGDVYAVGKPAGGKLIFYFTSRNTLGGDRPRSYFGNEWQPQLQLGLCEVVIPPNHTPGTIETADVFVRMKRAIQ